MNKENCHPNLYILKRREAHLSVSRSIPSIFRRRKRARAAQLESSNHQSPTNQLKHAQPHLGERSTTLAVESLNPHEPSKLHRTQQSMACKSKCNSRSSLDDLERCGKLNEGDHSVPSKHLRKSENQDSTYSQKLERRAIRTSEGGLGRVQLTVQIDATDTNGSNRNSKIFEDISNEIALESDHLGSQPRPESRGYTPSSHWQAIT